MRFLTLLLLFAINVSLSAQRQRLTINDNWRFMKMDAKGFEQSNYDDQYWQGVHIPHTWNAKDAFDEERGYYQGIGCYRKQFSLAESWKGRQIYLYFEGANHTAEVFVNGKPAGKHIGGYTAFAFNITNLVQYGAPNVLAVRVSNAQTDELAPISADFTFYGGIYRDVYLVSTSSNHFSFGNHAEPGIHVSTPRVSATLAQLQADVFVDIMNAAISPSVLVEVFDKEQKLVAIGKHTFKKGLSGYQKANIKLTDIRNPRLWHPDHPYLYQVKATLFEGKNAVDGVQQPLGLRWFRFDADKGFFINDKYLKLVGANRHQDFEGIGNALPDHQHRYDIQLLKDMGANFIRIAHYPQDPALLRACDELGIMAWEEIPIVNEIGMNKAFEQSSVSQLTDMITQHYNHPSIITWGFMNEVLLRFDRKIPDSLQRKRERATLALAKKLDSLAKKLDPYRPTTMALHGSLHYNETNVGNVTDLKGWNLYKGWYGGKFEEFGWFLDDDHKAYPTKPLTVAEYGAGSDLRLHSLEPEIYDFTCEYKQLYHESYFKQMLERPYVAACMIWNLVDFGSEGRRETMEQINNKGMVTMNRTKKDIYYYYKAALSKQPVVYIASRDWPVRVRSAENIQTKYTSWPIKVYSNRSFVELRVNGQTFGKQKPENFFCTWNVTLPHGLNRIEAISDSAIDVFFLENHIRPNVKSKDFDHIAVNVGCKVFFTDANTRLTWEPDQAYNPETGWGHIGGKPYRSTPTRIGSQDNIFHTYQDPLYQTMQDSIQAYRFDVLPGTYEVELHFAEANAKIKTGSIYMDFGAATAQENASRRVFDVFVNGTKVIEKMEPAGNNGQQIARCVKFEYTLNNDSATQGLELQFKALVGKPVLNGVFVKKLY
jgi:beta-galactosidase